MPFDLDDTTPVDTALISGYPADERNSRTQIKGFFGEDHDEASGDHDKVGLVQGIAGGGGAPGLDGSLGFVYGEDIGGETELFYKSNAGNVSILTTAGAVAPLALLKTGGTMTGSIVMDSADIDLGNTTSRIRGRNAADTLHLELLFVDAADATNVGNKNELLWSRASGPNDFVPVYPGGSDAAQFWHSDNDGAGTGLDADKVDGREAEAIFSAITNGGGFFFQSAGQSVIDDAQQTAIAHSLGAQPNLVAAPLRCTAPDAGYATGDEIPLAAQLDITGGVSNGLTYGADATNCFYTCGSGNLSVIDKSTKNETNLTRADWELIIRVWL